MRARFVQLSVLTALLTMAMPLVAGSLVDGFNVLVFNSFIANNSASSVPIAIAGNAKTNSYAFDQSLNSAVSGNYGTVVGGNLSMSGGSGPSPITYVGGTATLVNTSCNVGCTQTGGSSPVNFNLLQTQMLNESAYLSGMSTNGTVSLQNNGLFFTAGTPNQTLYLFSLNANQLTSGYTYLDFSGTGSATVIVNVNGSIAAGSSIIDGGFQGASGSNVLFNFYNAAQITVSSFNASVVAPFATVYGNPGDFSGTLVAENFIGGISASEFRADDVFSGTLPIDPNLNGPPAGSVPTPAPEPGTGYLLGGVVLAAAGVLALRKNSRQGK